MEDIPVTGDSSDPPRALTNDSIHQAPHQAPLSSLLSPTSRNTRSSTSQASQTSTRPFATGSTSNLSNSLPSSNNNNNNQGNGLEGDEQFDDSSLTAALVAALVQTRDGPHPQTSASTSNSNSNQDSNGVNPAGAQGQEAGESNDGEGEGQGGEEEEMAEGEGVSGFDGTTTRSGRKTRRTSAALASMSQSGTPSPSATPASGANGKKSARIRWTPQEDEELMRLVKEEPPLTWTQMGERMGRPGAGCAMRWYNFVRQQVGEAEADELSSKQRGGKTKMIARPRPKTTAASRVLPQPQQLQAPVQQQVVAGGAGNQPVNPSLAGEDDETRSNSSKSQMQPSEQMQVGSSREAGGQPVNNGGQRMVEGNGPEGYYPGGYHLTGQYVDLNTIPIEQLPPRLPPDPSKPGHPYPRTGAIHSNSGPNYLPDQALVKDPPIPFVKNTVIRGRRTHDADSLQAVIGAAPVGKQKKVHPCPADNCGAAFKRSEHLKRHYKSVHRGEKPFPCKIENCGKSFSRKDNLQQHQAMVHGVRAVYTYSDGTVSVNPPDGDEDPVDISYEEVDITKTARGAARHARQQAKATKAGSTKSTLPTGTKRKAKARVKKGPDQVEDEDMEDAEGEEDDMDGEFEGEEESLQVEPSEPQQISAARSNGPRLPSNVQGLMSTSSAANQSFSIGPTPIAKGRAIAESSGDGEGRASSESNERGGGNGAGGRGVVSDTRDPILGDKRFREMSDGRSRSASGSDESGGGRTNGNGGIDKRLRLTGDVQAHELDPALRVLADATAALSSGTSPYGGSTTPQSSIAPNSSGLTPLIQNVLEQRLNQPSLRSHAQQQDIPVGGVQPYSLPPPGHIYNTASRPFATSSENSHNAGGANGQQELGIPYSQLDGLEAYLKEHA